MEEGGSVWLLSRRFKSGKLIDLDRCWNDAKEEQKQKFEWGEINACQAMVNYVIHYVYSTNQDTAKLRPPMAQSSEVGALS
jgi:hypothetical protein